MATLSTLGQMMLALSPQIQPYNQQELTANRIQLGNIQNRTSLLDLAELERQLGTQAAARQYQREHPWTVLGGQPPGGAGATTLGGLGPAPMPGAGPITQGPLPGMPGQTQTIPAYPDASRYAAVSPQGGGPLPAGVGMPTAAPPPSALASLGPARHPLEGLARQNPDAARLVMAQQQAQETQRLQAQENLLKVRLTEAGAVGQLLQGATAGNWDHVKARVSEIAPQMGARLPQQYSKEAVQPYIDSAVSVEKGAALGIETLEAQTKLQQARMAGRVASTDQYLKALGVRPGEETPQDMQRALELQTQHQAQIQAGNVSPQIIQGEGGAYWAVNPRTLEKRPVPGEGTPPAGGVGAAGAAPPGSQLRAPMSAEDKKQAGYINRAQEGNKQLEALEGTGDYTAWTAPAQHLPGGRLLLSDKQKQYETAKGIFLQGILRRDSQGQITAQEWADYGRIYFPQPGDTADDVRQKRLLRDQYLESERTTLGRPSGQAAPSPGAASQAPLKPVGEMSREELLAERERLRKGGS